MNSAAAPPTDQDLCVALSDLFVDNVPDYDAIAAVARHFPIAHVETVLFDWVAPVCHANLLTAVPPVWSGFAPAPLWQAIADHRRRVSDAGPFRQMIDRARRQMLRRRLAPEWHELKRRMGLPTARA